MARPVVCFAPLQGYTNAAYRCAHHDVVGGVDFYYTPFLRLEHGTVRAKELRDVSREANRRVPTVPQVIARDREEFAPLCDKLQELGWRRIDFNMGCPFPMQTGAGRGSGLLPNEDKVREIFDEMCRRPEVLFSLKMRLGQRNNGEAQQLVPLINEMPLVSVTLHPRTGKQQYKGTPDREAFAAFYEACQKPLVYNGDITSREQMEQLLADFPRLHGVMIGRGLLSDPTMLIADLSEVARLEKLLQIHDWYFLSAQQSLQGGEQQLLTHLHAFWQYPQRLVPKKILKNLLKSGTLRNYTAAMSALRREQKAMAAAAAE